LIVTQTTPITAALQRETHKIPIVYSRGYRTRSDRASFLVWRDPAAI
jgi:hypothetical protein